MAEKRNWFQRLGDSISQFMTDTRVRFSRNPVDLNYYWEMGEAFNDIKLRQLVLQNPHVGKDVLCDALSDSDWQIRRDAILNQNTPYLACLERAKDLARNGIEDHPEVQEALNKRLNENFTMVSYAASEISKAREQGKAKSVDRTDGLIKDALQHSFEQTKLPENWQDRKPSLESIMNAAAKRAAAQPVQGQVKAPIRDIGMEH